MRTLARRFMPLLDLALSPFVYPSAHLLKAVRRAGVQRMPRCRSVLESVGVFPIRAHYYEPQFQLQAARPLSDKRELGGIDWNVEGQLEFLRELQFAGELERFGQGAGAGLRYRFGNGMFESGDAEYWYQLIRARRPRRIYEIGCGNSTLVAAQALARNRADDLTYSCEHVCVEPYEMPWLEQLDIRIVRQRVETLDLGFFRTLDANDILFIDSSHVIRPQGDVVFEYLELLPALRAGVIVHVHDVFSPRDYLKQWVVEEVRLWNEQYLLEAFLSHNTSWRVLGALNYLHHDHAESFRRVAPFVTAEREPCSFYLQKVN